jgi:hypothetical protein
VLLIDRILLRALPQQFADISAYLKTLNYDSQVNYDWVLMLLCQAIGQRVARRDLPFDWERLPPNVLAEISIVEALPPAVLYCECIPREMVPRTEPDGSLCSVG